MAETISFAKPKLEYLQETKNQIRDAIIAKGQTVSDTDTFRSYVDKIALIGEDEKETASYNLALAEAMMTRNARYLGDTDVLRMDGLVLSNGDYLGNIRPYAFAGFQNVQKMKFSNVIMFEHDSFRDNKNLKLIDITLHPAYQSAGFYPQALEGCTSLESVIFRSGGSDLMYCSFIKSMTTPDGTFEGTGANDTFYVYVPSEYYDTIVANISSGDGFAVTADRYRKLEDYPEINYWDTSFTVRCWDGDTLLATHTVKGGESLSYKPTKEGYQFFGWDTEPTSVVSDMDVHAVFVPANMGDATWTEIDMVAQSGRLSEFYAIGSEKDLTITHEDGTTEDVTMVLEAFDTTWLANPDDPKTYSERAKSSFLSKHALLKTMNMSSSSSVSGFYKTLVSDYLNGDVFNGLPADLQSVIKTAWTNVNNDTANTGKKCWIPDISAMQVTVNNFGSPDATCAFPRYTDNASRIKTLGANGAATIYWLRSHYHNGSNTYFAHIEANGSAYRSLARTTYNGIVFGFCI